VAGDPGAPSDSTTRRVLIGEMLIQAKCITREQLVEALAVPREPGKKIGQLLIERGWVTEAQLTQTLSLQLSVPWVSLYHIDFSRQLLNRVSRELAEKYTLIPIFVRHVKGQGETLYVAMDDPTNEPALAEISRLAGLPARPMIASASDIRSAIRVYYGDPAPTAAQMIDVPPPPTRVEGRHDSREMRESPSTTREGRTRDAAPPATPPVPTTPEQRTPSQPPHRASQPPPLRPRPQSQPPPPSLRDGEEGGPPTTRSNPPPGGVAAAAAADDEERARRRPPPPDDERARRRARMAAALNLTLLDGTQIKLPAGQRKKTEAATTELTARDYVSALRAAAHGADASDILGEQVRWEPVVAALLSILMRKGLIADWEFVEELKKI